jgi:hypothetical protein
MERLKALDMVVGGGTLFIICLYHAFATWAGQMGGDWQSYFLAVGIAAALFWLAVFVRFTFKIPLTVIAFIALIGP